MPLQAVPASITPAGLRHTLSILHEALRTQFALSSPRITVLGLNPHAGESGHLGREEIEVISPVCEQFRRQGLSIRGPVSADTAFLAHIREQTDAYLAMYHDQGLTTLKALDFYNAVNITLGLPVTRVSVDHGTALELAASGNADGRSLAAAIQMAIRLTI